MSPVEGGSVVQTPTRRKAWAGAAASEKTTGGVGSRVSPGTVPPPMRRLKRPVPALSAALRGAQGRAAGSDTAGVLQSVGSRSAALLPLGGAAAAKGDGGGAAAGIANGGSGVAVAADGGGVAASAAD